MRSCCLTFLAVFLHTSNVKPIFCQFTLQSLLYECLILYLFYILKFKGFSNCHYIDTQPLCIFTIYLFTNHFDVATIQQSNKHCVFKQQWNMYIDCEKKINCLANLLTFLLFVTEAKTCRFRYSHTKPVEEIKIHIH